MHEGHRNRLVSKVKKDGIVYKHELLEILLFNACPRRDLNATAHALIDRFDTFDGVFKADCADLEKVNGVGANMAEYIAVLGKALHAVRDKDSFAAASNVCKFKKFVLSRPAPENDRLELHCLDKDGRVRRIIIFKGEKGLRPAPEDSEILRLLSESRPYGLYVACRCAGGCRRADAIDDGLCARIDKIAVLCGANLYDYCVVGNDGEFYSYKMSDRGSFASNCTGAAYGE